MIQFNLLPDIKIEYLKANRQKHFVVLGAISVSIVAVTLLAILLGYVYVVQKKSIKDLSSDIKVASNELQSTPDLTKILTVQNQIKALPPLHDAKPVVSRLFSYLQQSTPVKAVNSRILSDFAQNTLLLSGSADSLATVNTYIDSLKGTTYHTRDNDKNETSAFSEVVLASFGRDSSSATYTITLKFDPAIFNQNNDVVFSLGAVPKNGAGQ